MPVGLRQDGKRILPSSMLALAALLLGGCGGVAAGPSAERGKVVYTTGTSPSGNDLTVTLSLFGGDDRAFPATRHACVNCHGTEGTPKVEGGVTVPNIQARTLAAPVRVANGTGRLRVGYDDAKLRRAITMGVDASGNRLNVLMPRFNISGADLDDLMAYLQVLGTEAAPGVGDKEVRFATVLRGDDPATAAAIRTTLEAFVAETNARGGVYGRKLAVDALTAQQWDARGAGDDAHLCVVAPDAQVAGGPPGVPVLGVVAPEPLLDEPERPDTFYLYPSQAVQLRVAIDHWCDVLKHAPPRFCAIAPDGLDPAALETALRPQLVHYEGATLTCVHYEPGAPVGDGDVLLLLGDPAHKARVLAALGGGADYQAIYATHKLPGEVFTSLPADLIGKLRLLMPVPIPAEADPRVGAFGTFLQRHGLQDRLASLRLATFTAAAVFTEALKRCGQSVTREKLLREVRSLYEYQPSLFAPLTYNLNRSIGAQGAQVVRFETESRTLLPVSDWSEPR